MAAAIKEKLVVRKSELFIDLKHLLFSTVIFDAIAKSLAISLLLFINEKFIKYLNIWESFPFLITFLLANIIGEFFPYLYHRISHVGNRRSSISIFLWKIHAIHHFPIALNWFKTNWIHPINMFLNTLLKVVPLLFLGISTEIIFCVGVIHAVIAYLSHANIKTYTGWLDYIVVTPKVHQFHHTTKLEEAKNFSNTLPFWDLVFGTYFNKKNIVENVGVSQDGFFKYPEHQKIWE